MEKLLPCPECGEQPKLSSLEPQYSQMKYFCGVHCSTGDWKETEELAEIDWNRRVKEYEEESQRIRVPLKKALFVLLYDRFSSTGDIDINMDDEEWVDSIVGALIESNKNICPYKNYDCMDRCEYNTCECQNGININCDNDIEIIWKKFMII